LYTKCTGNMMSQSSCENFDLDIDDMNFAR